MRLLPEHLAARSSKIISNCYQGPSPKHGALGSTNQGGGQQRVPGEWGSPLEGYIVCKKLVTVIKWRISVVVITPDSESGNPSSTLGCAYYTRSVVVFPCYFFQNPQSRWPGEKSLAICSCSPVFLRKIILSCRKEGVEGRRRKNLCFSEYD